MALARERTTDRSGPEREIVEGVVAQLRQEPAAFREAGDLARVCGLGAAKLGELVRLHFHSTPDQLLDRARVEAAQRLLLATGRKVAEVAFDVGYEGLPAFEDSFRRLAAMSPAAYRRLLGAAGFRIALPASYSPAPALEYLGRDAKSLTMQVAGRSFATGVRLGGHPAVLRAEMRSGAVRATIEGSGSRPLSPDAAAEAHAHLLRLLGLHRDPAPFERRIAADPRLAPLVAGREGLRIPQVPDPFDALAWVIVGQQITLGFAFTLRERLVQRAGVPAGGGLFVPPTAEAVANLDVEALAADQFSRRKAEYLIGTAQAIVSDVLPLDPLPEEPAAVVESRLLALRGVGPWTAQYVMLRACGFADCVPVGDSGLAAGLVRFFALAERPGPEETRERMSVFAPYRSLATAHLWASLGSTP
jgi:AraC family transcriptional regulator of adaptative response / DNA-3-methyladenine glycosylase II